MLGLWKLVPEKILSIPEQVEKSLVLENQKNGLYYLDRLKGKIT